MTEKHVAEKRPLIYGSPNALACCIFKYKTENDETQVLTLCFQWITKNYGLQILQIQLSVDQKSEAQIRKQMPLENIRKLHCSEADCSGSITDFHLHAYKISGLFFYALMHFRVEFKIRLQKIWMRMEVNDWQLAILKKKKRKSIYCK